MYFEYNHHTTVYYSISWHVAASRLAYGQHKSHMKKCLEFENNAVSHMTFSGQPTCRPGP